MQVIPLPKQGKTNRFEVRDSDHIYDVRDSPSSDGYRWTCTCGQPECRHIVACKGRLFGSLKRSVDIPAESDLIKHGGFRPFVEV